MNHLPLRDDVMRLLRFCPWAIHELSSELGASESCVREAVRALVNSGRARPHGFGRKGRRPVTTYEVAA